MAFHEIITKPLHYIFNRKYIMLCPNCHEYVDDTDVFCKHCGHQL